MKKTLVALAVLAAGSVSAAEVYNKDGVKLNLKGVSEVQIHQDYVQDDSTDNDNGEIRIDDGNIGVFTTVALTDSLSALGGVRVELDSDSSDTAETSRAYVGLSGAFGETIFGRQTTIADDAGIDPSFEVNRSAFGYEMTSGTDVIKYSFDNDMFYTGLSVDWDESDGDEYQTAGVIGFRAAGLDARVFYANGHNVDGSQDEEGFNVELVYSADALEFGASYGNIELQTSGTTTSDADYIEVYGGYTMDKTTLILGYSNKDDDKSTTDDSEGSTIYATAIYKFNANVRTYAEVGFFDQENGEDYDPAYTVGMEVKF